MKTKLTKSVVETTFPDPGSKGTKAKDIIIWDTELSGFFLKITPKGKRVYGVYYRNRDGKERRPALGTHSPAFTTENARKKAREWLGAVANGGDPSAEKKERKTGITIKELSVIYIKEHAIPHKKPRSMQADQSNLDNHIIPLLGSVKAKDITQDHIETFMRAVVSGKTRKVEKVGPHAVRRIRGGKGATNRCLSLLSFMLGNFCESRNIRPLGTNPCRHIKKYKTEYSERGRERFLSPKEFARLGQAIEEEKITKTEHPSAIKALELLIYTGCRRQEILSLKWEYVDFEEYCLRLPDSKTGRKVVPLGAPALKVLQSILPVPGNEYVLVGAKEGHHFVNIAKPWYRIRSKAKLDDVKIHDIRRSFGSVGARSGMSMLMIGKALAHKSQKATEVYARLSDDSTRQAVEYISNEVEHLMKPSHLNNLEQFDKIKYGK